MLEYIDGILFLEVSFLDYAEGLFLGRYWSDTDFENRRHIELFLLYGVLTTIFLILQNFCAIIFKKSCFSFVFRQIVAVLSLFVSFFNLIPEFLEGSILGL